MAQDIYAAMHATVVQALRDVVPDLTDDIVARVEQEALFRGATVVGAELVGLMPAGAAAAAAGAMLRIDGFDSSRVLELRLLER